MKPDQDQSTLHIRCGSDIRLTLEAAGLEGDFLEYSDPVCQGPVTAGENLLQLRADFINQAYEDGSLQKQEKTLTILDQAEQALARAASEYARVVLWFEHDSYDQLILCRVLAHFAEHGSPEVLEMVTTNHYPGIPRFIGLGQLDGDALLKLWQTRASVTAEQLALGRRGWQALQQAEPTALAELAASPDAHSLPYLSPALTRHLQELPSTTNGLGLTERLVLEPLHGYAQTVGQLFRRLMLETEPLPWLGDLMYWHIVRSLLESSTPPIEVTAETRHADWPHQQVRLTDTGIALLRRELDWMNCQPTERWLGGIRLASGEPDWRWDELRQSPVLR